MTVRRCLATLFIFFIFFLPVSFALEIPKTPQGYVSDWAEMISKPVESQLESLLRSYEQQTTNQIVVVTLPSLEGDSLEGFSIRLAEAWKVGQKGRGNGVIFLIFKDDQKIRIEVGYGLEGALPDALAGQIINNIIVPPFKEERFEEGIMSGVSAAIQALAGEFQPPKKESGSRQLTPEEMQAMKAFTRAIFNLVFIVGAVLFVIDLIRYLKYRRSHQNYRGGYTFSGWWIRFALLLFFINVIFRLVFYAMLASRGGYHGSRGGFGGFTGGGGSFGGGGASGRW